MGTDSQAQISSVSGKLDSGPRLDRLTPSEVRSLRKDLKDSIRVGRRHMAKIRDEARPSGGPPR